MPASCSPSTPEVSLGPVLQDRQNVEQLIGECEQRWDVRLPAGHTPDLPYMAHLLEPLRVVHHPLCLHLASEAAHAAAHAVLRARGFRPFWSKVRLACCMMAQAVVERWTRLAASTGKSCAACHCSGSPALLYLRLHRHRAS